MKTKIGITALIFLSGILSIQSAHAVDSETLKDILGGNKKAHVSSPQTNQNWQALSPKQRLFLR